MSTENKPHLLTVRDLVARWKGIYTERGIRNWAKYPHRGPARAFPASTTGENVVAYTLAAVEAFERSPRFQVRAAKRGAQ